MSTNGNIAGKIEKTNIMHKPPTNKPNAIFAKVANPLEPKITLNIANKIITQKIVSTTVSFLKEIQLIRYALYVVICYKR